MINTLNSGDPSVQIERDVPDVDDLLGEKRGLQVASRGNDNRLIKVVAKVYLYGLP
jgi:hypothetical protein